MANLGSYIDFDVRFDLSGDNPVVILTDTGAYPGGVPAVIKGNFSITEPDTGTVENTDYNNPDVSFEDGALTAFNYSPRQACDGGVQNGTWTISYTIEADGYDNTSIKKSFYLNFKAPEIDVAPDFDVFTPSLKFRDSTEYTVSGFSADISRQWSVKADDGGFTVTSTNQDIDLKYNNKYYDSAYAAVLNATVTYTQNTYSWLSVKVKLTGNALAYASTPPACSTMMNQLETFATEIECSCGDVASDKSYVVASTMLRVINKALADANYVGLYDNVVRYEKLVLGSYTYTNTGGVISAYVYNCGSITIINQGGGTVVSGEPIGFKVGAAGYPASGDTVFASPLLLNKVIFYMSKGNVILNPNSGAYTYTPDNGDGTGKIVMSSDNAFYQDEDVVIGVLPQST